MRSKSTRPARSRQVVKQTIATPLKQCSTALYMCAAFAKLFLKPYFRIHRKPHNRKLRFIRHALSVMALVSRTPQALSHLKVRHVRYEQTFYWLHSANPYHL